MSATCKISKYINNKKALYAKREKAEEKFLNEFVELYNEVKPIIDFMKQEDLYFFHPELSKNQRSDLGPIIGCDSSTHLYCHRHKEPLKKPITKRIDRQTD